MLTCKKSNDWFSITYMATLGFFLKIFFVARHWPVLCFLFLGLISPGTLPIQQVLAGNQPVMRVLLDQASRFRLRADSDLPLLIEGLPYGKREASSLLLRRRPGGVEVTLKGNASKSFDLNRNFLLSISSNDPRGIWLGNRRYKGVLRVFFRNGLLTVVNHLGIENYLASVIGSEMPKSWPLSALKAQAVAARTYALKRFSRNDFFDVRATKLNQVYLGVESETPMTNRAAAETRSLVLVYQGKLINAVFHSSSGGFTESSGDVWKKQLPYLVGVRDYDDLSPSRKWTVSFSPKELRRAFPKTGGLRSITIQSKTSAGRVRKVLIVGPRGSISLTGEELRQRLGLKSALVSFELLASEPQPHDLLDPKRPFKKDLNEDLDMSGLLISPQEEPSSSNKGDFSFQRGLPVKPPPLLPPPPLPPVQPISRFKESIDLPFLYVRGLGAGHGVGMSQWGAYGLANRGLDFIRILNYYYKDVEVVPYRRVR